MSAQKDACIKTQPMRRRKPRPGNMEIWYCTTIIGAVNDDSGRYDYSDIGSDAGSEDGGRDEGVDSGAEWSPSTWIMLCPASFTDRMLQPLPILLEVDRGMGLPLMFCS